MFTSDFSMGRGVLIYVKENFGATDFNVTATYQQHLWCQLRLEEGIIC